MAPIGAPIRPRLCKKDCHVPFVFATSQAGQDIDYYNLMKAWSAKDSDSFTFVNSHDKAAAVRDDSLKETLRRSLMERLRNSKNMVLIIGETTRLDDDWVPFEIE